MKIIEKLKNLFKRNNKENQAQNQLQPTGYRWSYIESQKLLHPEQNYNNRDSWRDSLKVDDKPIIETLKFTRADGSVLTLTPRMQMNGEQECEIVNNYMKGIVERIPRYIVESEEFSDGAQILGHNILLNMDINQIKNLNPEEQNFFSNVLLSRDRIKKVVNQYAGYAGLIYRNP